MPGHYTLRKTYVDGDVLSASDYVADHQQHIDNLIPAVVDQYSANVTQMQAITDTGDVGSESLATTLAGELERLRFAIKQIKGVLNGSAVAQWYAKAYTIATAALADASVTNAKLAGAITGDKLSNGATFIQAINTSGNSALFQNLEVTAVSQAITTTRTRVRLAVSVVAIVQQTDANSHAITFRVKRGATVLATLTGTVHGIVNAETETFRGVVLLDVPGVATTTYSVTAQGDGVAMTATATAQLYLEEVL